MYNEYGINKNTYNMLFCDKNNLEYNLGELSYEFSIINVYTRMNEKNLLGNLIKKFSNLSYGYSFDNITYDESLKSYRYIDGNKIITFNKLSDNVDDEKIKEELLSKKRFGKCHKKSIEVAQDIKNSKVLIGYIISGNVKHLHSVVETTNSNGLETIVDYTRNIIMEKQAFLKFSNYVELNSTPISEVLETMDILYNNISMNLIPFLCFEQEIRKELDKNKTIFEENKYKK